MKERTSKSHDNASRAETALRAVFPSTAKVRVRRSDERHIDLNVNGTLIQLQWVGEGGLRQVKEVLGKRPRPNVVVGRHLSPGARAALSTERVGWVDETGAAEIVLGPIVVSRSGRPEPPRAKKTSWTPSVLAVSEALLCGEKATVAGMVQATGLSTGACTSSLKMLTELGLLSATVARGRGAARRIEDKDRLLDAYAAASTERRSAMKLEVGVTWREITKGLSEIGLRWDRLGIPWAATGILAGHVLAPFMTSVSSGEVYVDADTIAGLEAAATRVDLKPIEGGRITLRPFPTATAKRLTTAAKGLRIAPWPRVYADLREVGVRGEDAAEHLREVMNAG